MPVILAVDKDYFHISRGLGASCAQAFVLPGLRLPFRLRLFVRRAPLLLEHLAVKGLGFMMGSPRQFGQAQQVFGAEVLRVLQIAILILVSPGHSHGMIRALGRTKGLVVQRVEVFLHRAWCVIDVGHTGCAVFKVAGVLLLDISTDQAGIDCKSLATHQPFFHAARNSRLKHVAQQITLAETPMAVL